ncbi:MAG: HEAT repeat domain-containing protein [Polyangiales bacterium]
MSVLASLLVRDQVISVDRVQGAIQDQVMRGGNLDTVLLELGLLRENEMNAYCAAVYGLLPATRDEVMQTAVTTIRVLPREFAVRHRLIPVARTEDAVVLAVDRPLPDATMREISFELGIDPVQRIVCSVRVEAGLSLHYDIEMTARMRQLSHQLEAADPGTIPYVVPFDGVGSRSSIPPIKDASGSFPRVNSSIPSPTGIADTEPPVAVAPNVATSVPAGTFRDSDPAASRSRSEPKSGFVDATRYSLPPRPPEILGRPSMRQRSSKRPSGASSGRTASRPSGPTRASQPAPATGWQPAPTPAPPPTAWQPAPPPRSAHSGHHLPVDPRRDNDGSAMSHDVVSLPPGTPSSAPPNVDSERASRRWNPAPAPLVDEGSLPSVIVNFGDEVEGLVAALRNGSPEDDMLIPPLLSIGEAALPALVREFPGKLWFDRNEPHANIPAGRDVSPIARAFVAFGAHSVPYLIPLLDDEDPDIRYYAAVVASEFVHPDLVRPVGRRLFDTDPGVRSNAYRALSVLYACEVEFTQLIERLRASARDGRNVESQAAAVDALGRLRDADSFEFFVSLLESPDPDVVGAAHASLVRLSCQDFNRSKKKWSVWYEKHRAEHRVVWLINALMHSDERLRRRAGDELRHLTQEDFGYEPGKSKKLRIAAQKKYRTWWVGVGFRMFVEPQPGGSGHAQSQ